MPNAPQSQVSLLIHWPQGVPASPTPEQLMRRLAQDRLAATWAIEQASQVRALRALGGAPPLVETAVLAGCHAPPSTSAVPPAADWSASIARQVAELRATGTAVSTLQLAVNQEAAGYERRLRALGVRAVVTGAAASKRAPSVRSLPFGLWQFAPRVQVPAQGMWRRIVGSLSRRELVRRGDSTSLATIDLGAIRPASGGAWRQVEELLSQAAEANRNGSAAVVTVGDAALRLAETNSSRPQRSILRAA